ncbi:PucR family transcriptional regulator [Nocardia sp. NPDC056100]|uniref:PucR family transcriptional regulator n=1 Tax=Nocardia sp. NPDC056100 TaxID=3345712 RepID=UPI0035DCA324
MRLRSVLTFSDLGFELVTGEADLDREVRWVVTTDLIDPSRYLSGGELVVTGMHWRHEPSDSDTFVHALATAGVTGMLAGQARYGGIPDDVVRACRRHGVPLLRVPERVSFSVVVEQLNRELSTGHAGGLTAMLDRHRRHIAGNGLTPVLDLLHRDLGIRCWIMSATGRVVAGPQPPPHGAAAAFLTARSFPVVLREDEISYSIVAADEKHTPRVLDWLLVFAADLSDWSAERRALAGELCALVASERDRQDERLGAENRVAQRLIQLIVADTEPGQLISALELTGLRPGGSYVAVALTAGTLREDHTLALLIDLLDGQHAVAGVIDGTAIALIPAGEVDADIRRAVTALAPGLGEDRICVGISAETDRTGLRAAVEEARYACGLAARAAVSCIIGQHELATRTMLLAGVPELIGRKFRTRLLEPLLTYDREHHADLVLTLRTFLDESGSWARCANLMFVHVNTLRYRIARIEELTGRDLSRFEDRVDFYLALSLS